MALTPIKNNPPSLNSVLQSNPGDRVSASKGEVAPIVAVLSRQLPLPQAQQLAGQTVLAKVIKGGPNGDTLLQFAGQNIPVKLPSGKMLNAGEMITVNFALSEKSENQSARETGSTKKTQDVQNLLFSADEEDEQSSSFVNKLSSSARLIGFLDRVSEKNTTLPTSTQRSIDQMLNTARHIRIDNGQPLESLELTQLNKDISGNLARQVSSAVENSGLFYESHLKEWANGQRSKEQLALEPQTRFDAQQVISEKSIDPNALNQSVRMVTAQLAVLDHNRISLNMNGLLAQPVHVEIEPDETPQEEDNQNNTEPARPWVANLKLDMEHLGPLEVRIRMMGNRCDVNMIANTEGKEALDHHWREFQSNLDSKGIALQHGQITPRDKESNLV